MQWLPHNICYKLVIVITSLCLAEIINKDQTVVLSKFDVTFNGNQTSLLMEKQTSLLCINIIAVFPFIM